MRRIWAHIIIAITAIITMVVTFVSVTNNLNVGMDYANGKTLTFHVTQKTDNGENNPKEFISTGDNASIKEVAETMKNRLEAAEINDFEVAEFGNDLIKVTLYQDSVEYSQIKEYLTFNGSLYLYSYDTNKMDHYVSSEVFINGDKPAYLKDTNTIYPTINIPVDLDNKDYEEVFTGAVESNEITTKEESSEGAGDAETARFMYLCYNFVPGRDSFESENFQNLVLLRFEVKTTDAKDKTKIFDYYVDGDTYALSTVLNIGDSEGNVDSSNVKTAWKNGTFYVNLLNAGSYDFDVTCINEEIAPAKVEAIYNLNKNQSVLASSTFIAFAACVLLTSLILIIFYKLGALSIAVTSLGSVFIGILFLMLFGTEFNMIAVVGLILVGFASLASGCVYMNKFKEEAYRGRSVKKANTEASKKSTLVVTDIHFALIVLGAFNYLIGGAAMKGFALVTVLAGLVSLILNLTVFKGFLWLDTNASATQGKYNLFGVDQTKVPNLASEEKQSYFGAYADKDFTKKSKLAVIISGVAFVATLAAMITFGVVKGSVYNNPEKVYETELFIKLDNEESFDAAVASDNIKTILNTISKDAAGNEKLSDSFGNLTPVDFDVLEYDNEQASPYVMHCYGGYIVKINNELPENIYYNGTQYKTEEFFLEDNPIIQDAIGNADALLSIEIGTGSSSVKGSPNTVRVIIATGAALLTTGLYLLLRYKLSRGLGAIVTTLIGTTFVAGICSLLHFIPVTNAGVLGAVVGEFVCFVFAILLLSKEKDLVLDDKKHDNSFENRNLIMKNAVSYGFNDILNIAIIGLYIGVNFLFGPNTAAWSWTSVGIFIATAVAFCLAMFVLGPVSQFFFKKFANVGKAKPRKAKAKGTTKNKSAEPEEAIFIGIND